MDHIKKESSGSSSSSSGSTSNSSSSSGSTSNNNYRRVRLLQLYNPWGLRRWRGKWNNYDVKTWTEEYPEIASACSFDLQVNDDGVEMASEGPDTFWISFEDFVRWFDEFHTVWTPPSDDWHSIKYEVHSKC